MWSIREETPADRAAIAAVNQRAFGDDVVPRMVDRLRDGGLVIASLVATVADEVVGHVMFTRLTIERPAGNLAAATLSPLAVAPEHQNQGIGGDLTRRGVALCRERGVAVIAVLGHPTYYPRFGFSAELGRRIDSRYAGAGDAFMALEIVPGILAAGGRATFSEAFAIAEDEERARRKDRSSDTAHG